VRSIRVVAFLLVGAVAACDAPHAANPGLWTVGDVQALYRGGAPADYPIADDAGLPGGVKLEKILDSDQSKLAPRATIAEGYNGAYLTTEVWSHFDEVWLQPMYIPVTVAMDGTLTPLPNGPSNWIFSVGPGSRFYSPFWQMVYVEVQADTPQLTTVRQVLDGKYPLHFGPGRTVSLLPDGVSPPLPLTTGTAWVDGAQTSFVDFGKQTFTWNADAVIDELPIFVFLMRKADGTLGAPDIPTVAGTGPLGSGGPPPPTVDGINRYVTYWRIYTVTLPPTARVYAPAADLTKKLTDEKFPAVMSYTLGPDQDPDQAGWVALNPSNMANDPTGCFETLDQLDPHPTSVVPRNCIWLDSQAAIENLVDRSAIQRTDVTVTCPFITFNTFDVSPVK